MGRIGRLATLLGLADENELRARVLARLRANGVQSLTVDNRKVLAVINAGRWIIRCLSCNAGVLADPAWKVTICFDCGHVYRPTFPAEVDQIEQVLDLRIDARNQNWEPGESLEFLWIENQAHGVHG